MPLPPKEYFTLEEIEERWRMRRRDLVYYAENGLLELSARVVEVVLERGAIEEGPDGRWCRVPDGAGPYTGLLALRERDLMEVFRNQGFHVRSFRAAKGRYCEVRAPAEGVRVQPDDLVVARAERDRFEQEHGLAASGARGAEDARPPRAIRFSQRNDYAEVTLDGRTFRLGPCQAAVVRLLHEASRTSSPWLPGKVVLSRAGSCGTRMRDLFKTQPHWRELILSNGRGMYRLNLP